MPNSTQRKREKKNIESNKERANQRSRALHTDVEQKDSKILKNKIKSTTSMLSTIVATYALFDFLVRSSLFFAPF